MAAERVLMLGWEFPPHISGGLGTACEGLSRALARAGCAVMFVVPRLLGGERSEYVYLVDADGNDASRVDGEFYAAYGIGGWRASNPSMPSGVSTESPREGFRKVVGIPAALKPYLRPEQYLAQVSQAVALAHATLEQFSAGSAESHDAGHYAGDLFDEVQRYAIKVVSLFAHERMDIIHAHDWMTYPAAIALSKATGKPWVAHVHSIERDRSGAALDSEIARIERWGLSQADQVIAVSHFTAELIRREYGLNQDKVHVVHNGVYPASLRAKRLRAQAAEQKLSKRMVLFLGRVTFQKGPDYFVEAAARVAPLLPDVQFVMAGSGDMLEQCRRRVKELGLTDRFEFPGFLRGQEVEEVFAAADLYVMPSVSEPFGISALEALSHETPVIMSRQSGVAEVIRHALKVDFWDVERMADLIRNALEFPELRTDMVRMAQHELKQLRWDAAAARCIDIYRQVR